MNMESTLFQRIAMYPPVGAYGSHAVHWRATYTSLNTALEFMRYRLFALAIVIALISMSASVNAQTAASQVQGKSVEQQYKSCTNGYYTGPRPGRVRYTKDKWIWVVTPEFAQKFCMPTAFISNELKGAEAIAFKVMEENDEEVCGWGDKVEVCSGRKSLRFEIYIKTSINLPKKRDVAYYSLAAMPSRFLIAMTKTEIQSASNRPNNVPRVGALDVFESQQVGLQGVKDGKIIWPITTLYTQIYFRELFDGIDYMAFHGLTGFWNLPRMEKEAVQDFVISFRHLKDEKKNDGKDLKELAHVITLPKAFADKLRAIDKAPGMGIEELGKRALGLRTN